MSATDDTYVGVLEHALSSLREAIDATNVGEYTDAARELDAPIDNLRNLIANERAAHNGHNGTAPLDDDEPEPGPPREMLLERYGELYGRLHLALAFTVGLSGKDAKRVTTTGWDKTKPLPDGPYGAGLLKNRGVKRNPAVVLRASGLIGVECDTPEGLELIRRLNLPATVTVQSRAEAHRLHFWFRPPADLDVIPYVAFRFEEKAVTADEGRYLLVPPALHPTGAVYRFLRAPDEHEIAALSTTQYAELVRCAKGDAAERRERLASDPAAKIPEGQRRNELLSIAGTMRRRGLSAVEILATLQAVNRERCTPPLDEAELRALADDVASRYQPEPAAAARSAATPAPTTAEPAVSESAESAAAAFARLTLRNLELFNVRRVEWLDKPFLQRSAFHLLAGRKGSCKGTYLCGLAARVSRGELYDRPKRVLVITSEDSVELDFLPRVIAAGGDPSMIEIVLGPFKLPGDLAWIEQKARELGDVGLIIIDPIGNHLDGADTDKEGLVRNAIQSLNPIADTLDCMIVGVRHLGKDVTRGALASVLGSTAWVDVPRCVILMAIDDEDERIVHAQVVAGNRGPRGDAGRAFRLELVDVAPAEEITLLVPAGVSTKNVEALLGGKRDTDAPANRSAEASELILDILETEGEQESDALDARIAAATGLAARTSRNLRDKLKTAGLISAVPDKDEHGAINRWLVRRTQAPRGDES